MRELVFRTMTGIVHYERSLVLLAHYSLAGIGICHSRSLYNGWIRVPHHLVDTQRRILGYHLFGYGIGILHVAVVVAVVAHEHYFVEPCRSSGILHVALYLVNHCLGIGSCGHGETSDCHIHLVDIQRAQSFAVVKHAVKRIVDIAKSLVERLLAFVCQQIIVSLHLSAFGREQAVVPHAAAEKHEILGLIGCGCGAVVQHLQITAVCRGVRRAA